MKAKNIFLGYIDKTELKYTNPEGAYYILVDISDFNTRNDTTFCHSLAKETGVAAVPGSSFFHEPVNHLIRFLFTKKK